MFTLQPFSLSGYPTTVAQAVGDPVGVDDEVVLQAEPGGDIFLEPGTTNSVCKLTGLGAWTSDQSFQFSARIEVDFRTAADSGIVLAWLDQDNWFKLCAEQDAQGHPRVVSVVTRGRSDDSNGRLLTGESVHLRISRKGDLIAMHSSTEGTEWDLVRLFEFAQLADRPVLLGLAAQSPTGQGTTATFDRVHFANQGLTDPRGTA
jgi:regulation of enolase protein 1 (concanavalin A-like superfamily)